MKNAKLLFAIALLLIFSFGCVGSVGPPKNFWVWGFGAGMAGVALATVVFLLALGYFAATLIGDDKIKAWTKKEIGQAVYSVIILLAAVSFVGSLDELLKGLSLQSADLVGDPTWSQYISQTVCCDPAGPCTGPIRTRPCHIEIASDYLQFLYETARMNAIAALLNYQFYGFLANMSVGISLLGFAVQAGLSVTPLAGLSAAADYFSIVFDMAVKTMMLLRAQQVMIDFLNYPIFGILLSMGLILRILYFTRKLGGLIVAIALTMYIVYPMFYVVSHAILWDFSGWKQFGVNVDETKYAAPFSDTDPSIPSTRTNFLSSSEAKNLFDPSNRVNLDICNSPAGASERTEADLVRDNFRGKWDQIEGGKWFSQVSDLFDAGIGNGFDKRGPVGTLASIMVFSLLIPFLAFMTSLASIKVLSPMIGGDVEIAVLSRLI